MGRINANAEPEEFIPEEPIVHLAKEYAKQEQEQEVKDSDKKEKKLSRSKLIDLVNKLDEANVRIINAEFCKDGLFTLGCLMWAGCSAGLFGGTQKLYISVGAVLLYLIGIFNYHFVKSDQRKVVDEAYDTLN